MKINKLLLPLFVAMTLALVFGCANPASPDNGGGGNTPPGGGGENGGGDGGGDTPPSGTDYTRTLAKLAGTYEYTYVNKIDKNFNSIETVTITNDGIVTYKYEQPDAPTNMKNELEGENIQGTLDDYIFSYGVKDYTGNLKDYEGHKNPINNRILVNEANTEYALVGKDGILLKKDGASTMKDFIGTVTLNRVYPTDKIESYRLNYTVEMSTTMGKRGFYTSDISKAFDVKGFNSDITEYDSTKAITKYVAKEFNAELISLTDTVLIVKTDNLTKDKETTDFATIDAFTYVLNPVDAPAGKDLEDRIVVKGSKEKVFAGLTSSTKANVSEKNIEVTVGLVLLEGSSIDDFKKINIERQIPGQAWTEVEADVITLLGTKSTAMWTDTNVTLPNVYRYRTTATFTNDTSITSSAGSDIIFCPEIPRITKTGNTSKSNLRGLYAFNTHEGFTMTVTRNRDLAGEATKSYTFDDTIKSISVDIVGKDADIDIPANNTNIDQSYTLIFSYVFEVNGKVYSKTAANPPKFTNYK